MRIKVRTCFLVLLLLSGRTSRGQQDVPAAKRINIGAIASLSGPAAEQGRNWLNGAQLAKEELKAAGRDFVLKVEDDGTNPAQVATAFHKLVNVDHASAIIGGTWDFLAETAFPLTERYRIPFLTPTNPVELIDPHWAGNPLIFTNGLSLLATKEAMRGFLQKFRPASASIIVPNVPFGVAHARMVEELGGELGIRILSRRDFEYAGYKETIKTLALAAARKEKPDLIFILTDYAALDLFMAELERLNFFPLVLTTQHLDEAARLSNKPARYARAFGIYPRISDPDFNRRFQARFGHAPKVYAANGYDAFRFLAAALVSGADLSQPGYEYKGLLGAYKVSTGTRALVLKDCAVTVQFHDGALHACRECMPAMHDTAPCAGWAPGIFSAFI